MATKDTYIASQRFGLGSSFHELEEISNNPRGWVKNQLNYGAPQIKDSSLQSSKAMASELQGARNFSVEKKQEQRKFFRQNLNKELSARFYMALTSETPFLERLVLFWNNHFTVSNHGKGAVTPYVGAYEREAIRPHVLGNFEDMLLAVAKHPAMLTYLDNSRSFGPNSQFGKNRKRGLNENLAREILELHTLGVHGGYSQSDVIEFAKILTGWTVNGTRQIDGFQFIPRMHEPGSKTLLGKTYSSGTMAEGEQALRDLARHPSTAQFVATKLAIHFLSDTPSQQSIDALSRSFTANRGNLKAVYETLINLDEAWDAPQTKMKKPYEYIISSCRLVSLPKDKLKFNLISQAAQQLGEPIMQAPSPAGWPEKQDDWLTPNSIMSRVEWAQGFSQLIRNDDNPYALAKAALGENISEETLKWIERAPSPVDGLALLLASPEWQRR